MLVTKVEKFGKSRSKIYIEQELAFVLYKGELRLYQIREGTELSSEDYLRIKDEVLLKRAKLRTMNLLQRREYTTAQLRTKLQQGFYPEDIIEAALEYVASFHYTDDLRYAVDYIRGHEDSRSRRRIEQDLLGKGIPRDVLQDAWQSWEQQGGAQDEVHMIKELLKKRHFDFETADYNEIRKQSAFLIRKGYSGENIRKALKSSGAGDDMSDIGSGLDDLYDV